MKKSFTQPTIYMRILAKFEWISLGLLDEQDILIINERTRDQESTSEKPYEKIPTTQLL